MKTRINFNLSAALSLVLLFFPLLWKEAGGSIYSQAVGISGNGAAPDASALLDVDATGMSPKKGLLIPRMTTTERDAIPAGCSCTPAEGLQIFNTTTKCLQIYSSSTWQNIFCDLTCAGPPATPGTITGLTSTWQNQTGVTYSIAQVAGATSYSWTVPTGSSITAGQGTSGVIVTFATTDGNVSVTASNSCGTSTAQTLAITLQPRQQQYTTAGTYTWQCPTGVTKVSVVAVGGGGGGGGGGGALAYKNNISVTAGSNYTVVVGAGGTGGNTAGSPGGNGGSSSFTAGFGTMTAGGGDATGPGGVRSGVYDGGGSGGAGSASGGYDGGGAAGYSGNGGNSSIWAGTACGQPGAGGGGGGGDWAYNSGGGVGILGQGANGANCGKGGSGGANGGSGSGGPGGAYGGAGNGGAGSGGAAGGVGAVRIIWPGDTRLFPSTGTGNQ